METNTPEKLLEGLTILDTNLPTYKAQVEATTEEMTDVNQYRANLAQALANDELINSDRQASTAIKNAVFNGDPNQPVSPYPPFAITPLPFPALSGGADVFYRELKRRYKTAKGYTKQIGIALGFESAGTDKPPLDSLVGAANVKDIGGYKYQADFKKSGATAYAFQQRVKGTEKWFDAKTALTSPVIISVDEPAVEGAAVQLEIRCRPMKGNDLIGRWSPLYSLTVTP